VRQRVPNVPWTGNAASWLKGAKDNGWLTGQKPVVGAIAVFNVGAFGHVAYIEEVGTNGRFRVSHCNWAAETGNEKDDCLGWTAERCTTGTPPNVKPDITKAKSKWVTANGQFENSSSSAKLSGIIYPPNLKAPVSPPAQAPAPNQPKGNNGSQRKAVPQYAIRISNIDVPAEASIDGRVVARVISRGDTGAVPINNLLHSGDNKIRFKLGSDKRPHTYHFVLLENGHIKWEKKCGQVDRTPCKEKLNNGEKSITLRP
jgi:hypothetical protein